MELIFGIILGLVILVFLVVIHELGHAIVARRNGVVVEEFGIGFPPRVWGKRLKSGILFSVNWLPLGGFVRMQGEHDSASEKGDYGAATFWQKTKILLAGVAVNWLAAALLLSMLAFTGMPQLLPNQYSVDSDLQVVNKGDVSIATVVKGSPAEKAGFEDGDRLKSFAGTEITNVKQFIRLTHEYSGDTVRVAYERDGRTDERSVTLLGDDNKSVFGAGIAQQQLHKYTWAAPVVGFGTTPQFTGETFKMLGQLVGDLANGVVGKVSPDESRREQADEQLGRAGESVSGPVGILGVLFPSVSQAGLSHIVFVAAVISLSLAIMNILPIPALDGGRWYTMAIFKILKKPLTKEREESIQSAGFLVLLALIILVTFSDVSKLLS